MAMTEEARKASYERAVAQATQDIINWATNSEARQNMFAAMGAQRTLPLHMWRVRFQLWVVKHIGNHLSLTATKFDSDVYDDRRVTVALWYGDAIDAAKKLFGRAYGYEHDDALGAVKDILDTGIWLADDGGVTITTLMDAYMLTLSAVDWRAVAAYFQDTGD